MRMAQIGCRGRDKALHTHGIVGLFPCNAYATHSSHLEQHQEKCQAYSFLAQRMNSDLLYDEGESRWLDGRKLA